MLSRSQAILFFIFVSGIVVSAALGLGKIASEHTFDVRNQAWKEVITDVLTEAEQQSRVDLGTDSVRTATASRIIDGDTFVLENDERVRLIGIDTPEVSGSKDETCYAAEATQLATELLLDKSIQLVYDKDQYDRYGRTLAYVYVGETFVNEALVASGAAVAKAYPPNTAQQSVLEQAEAHARSQGLGLWGNCQ